MLSAEPELQHEYTALNLPQYENLDSLIRSTWKYALFQ
jgi:hypothetical protein